MKTIIEMAREAGIRDCTCDGTRGCLERLVELVRADEQRKWEEQTDIEIQEAVTDERESCAALVQSNAEACDTYSTARRILESNAAAIRARGNT